MKRLSIIVFAFLLLAGNQLSAQSIDLLNNSTEDGSFSTYTSSESQFWTPTLKPGTGFWGTDGANGTRTSVRYHASLHYYSQYHYLQVVMDENNNGGNYLWRKLSDLTPGATYTFTFYQRMVALMAGKSIKFAVVENTTSSYTLGTNGGDINTFNALLGGSELVYNALDAAYVKSSYTFTVPEDKTEVYAVWLRSHRTSSATNVTHRIFLDDMSLFKHVQEVQSGETLIVDKDASINSITLKPGAKLNINSGTTLNATVGITLESDETGTATIKNNGTYSGTITAQQYLGTARNWYVSSPVSSATAPASNVDYYYEYMEGGNNTNDNNEWASQPGSPTLYWKGVNNGSSMAVGKGYIAKANAGTTISFTGTPNNGIIETSFNLTRNDTKGKGFNLAGNPYPSYIDWTDVAAANPNLDNTFYYRTKNIDETYAFVTWNGSGNTYVNSKGGIANTTITRYIPPTQAFWVRVKKTETETSATKMYFNNDMREHRDDNGNLMKAPGQDTRPSVRLQLHNGSQSDALLIYQDAGASNDYDSYDSPKMMNNSTTVPDLYSMVGGEQLVINGLNAITENMELPLGFSLKSAAALTIKATELNNLPEGMNVYLLDKSANTQTQLTTETEYSFTTTEATTNDENRFSLLFKSPSFTTLVEASDLSKQAVFVNAQNELVIIAPENSTYAIYTMVGEQVKAGRVTDNTVRVNTVSKGVYLVKVNNRTMKVAIR